MSDGFLSGNLRDLISIAGLITGVASLILAFAQAFSFHKIKDYSATNNVNYIAIIKESFNNSTEIWKVISILIKFVQKYGGSDLKYVI